MKEQDFINLILENIDSQELATPETKLIDFPDWNSLASMVTIGLAADIYKANLTSDQLRKCETFNDIIKLCI